MTDLAEDVGNAIDALLNASMEEVLAPTYAECVGMLYEARAAHDRAVEIYKEAGEMFNEAKALCEEAIGLNRTAMLDMTPTHVPN